MFSVVKQCSGGVLCVYTSLTSLKHLLLTCFVETIVNLCLLGLVLFHMMYTALDHFMESRTI